MFENKEVIINLIVYIFIILFLVRVIMVERKDNTCPSFTSTTEECKKGGPMCYSWTEPNDTDSIDELLKKIETCSKANSSSVKWRRILITSFGIIVGLWITLSLFIDDGELTIPDWRITCLSLVVVYTILFSTFNYYDFHLYKGAELNTGASIKEIRDKLGIF
jgi:hypothetical protein